MHVVLFHHQLQKLHRHHDGEDHARNGQNHLIGQAADHTIHAAVPRLWRRADLSGDSGHLGVHLIEQPLKVSHDAAYQNILKPVRDPVPDKVQPFPPF